MALPEGMLSVQHRYPMTRTLGLVTFRTDMVDSTTAAPVMSIFMLAWLGLVGLSEMPPESYVMPLPTRATVPTALRGEYSSFTSRGGSTEPWLTPRSPPRPSSAI